MKSPIEDETMEYSGERMMPEKADLATFWEHLYRYKFASQYVKDKRVLDIACGEGYGTAALHKAGASNVIGVDIDAQSCEYARLKYGIDARTGDATVIPVPDASVDVVVSFETVEHISQPEVFVKECARVLSRNGQLIISTPNRDVYRQMFGGWTNPYHCSELTKQEFTSLLSSCFHVRQLLTQSPSRYFLRGIGRLKRTLQPIFSPHLQAANIEKYRCSPVETILRRDRFGSSVCNSYKVQSQSVWHGQQPVYFVALAQKR